MADPWPADDRPIGRKTKANQGKLKKYGKLMGAGGP